MNEGSRKTALVVGAVAAAAGVAIASYLFAVRSRSRYEDDRPLRNVKEILNDCYVKIREIQNGLTELQASQGAPPAPERT